jgi:hypothetical protein
MIPSSMMAAPGPTVMTPARAPVVRALLAPTAGGTSRRGVVLAVAVIASATLERRRSPLCVTGEQVSARPRIVIAPGDDQHHRGERHSQDDDDQRAGPAARRPIAGSGYRRSWQLDDPRLVEVGVVEHLVDTRLGCARRDDPMLGCPTAGALRRVVDDPRSFTLRALVNHVELLGGRSCFVDHRLRRLDGVVVVELGERNDLLGQRQLER